MNRADLGLFLTSAFVGNYYFKFIIKIKVSFWLDMVLENGKVLNT
jgi:hypothetical protein